VGWRRGILFDLRVVLVGVELVNDVDSEGGGLGGVRLLPALLQLLEELGRCVGTRTPQDPTAHGARLMGNSQDSQGAGRCKKARGNNLAVGLFKS
jgi:hypothetical protein